MFTGGASSDTSKKGLTEYLPRFGGVAGPAAELKGIRSPEDEEGLDLCFSKTLLVWIRVWNRRNTNWVAN